MWAWMPQVTGVWGRNAGCRPGKGGDRFLPHGGCPSLIIYFPFRGAHGLSRGNLEGAKIDFQKSLEVGSRGVAHSDYAHPQLRGRGAVGGRVLRTTGQQPEAGRGTTRGQRSCRAMEAAAGGPACRGRAPAAAGEDPPHLFCPVSVSRMSFLAVK